MDERTQRTDLGDSQSVRGSSEDTQCIMSTSKWSCCQIAGEVFWDLVFLVTWEGGGLHLVRGQGLVCWEMCQVKV